MTKKCAWNQFKNPFLIQNNRYYWPFCYFSQINPQLSHKISVSNHVEQNIIKCTFFVKQITFLLFSYNYFFFCCFLHFFSVLVVKRDHKPVKRQKKLVIPIQNRSLFLYEPNLIFRVSTQFLESDQFVKIFNNHIFHTNWNFE